MHFISSCLTIRKPVLYQWELFRFNPVPCGNEV
uniref:Uncharacterized protein n=1 Tax=Anguilla anguilla TaxID=7936 RepID=A0A0E9P5M1_ANGAN